VATFEKCLSVVPSPSIHKCFTTWRYALISKKQENDFLASEDDQNQNALILDNDDDDDIF
jgi:hypothetical protein